LLFSEKWAADKNGERCYGTVSFVYARRGRHLQKYRVKYDEGTTMEAEDAHLELVEDNDESDGDESGDEMGGINAANSDGDTVAYEDDEAAIRRREEDEEGKVTDDSEGEPGEDDPGNLLYAEAALRMGDTVEAHGKTWKRVGELTVDARTEPELSSRFKRLHYSESTKEVDVFLQLLPLPKDTLLQIVRDGAAAARDKRRWEIEHVKAALCVIFGGAQYKEGTNLWATSKKGMLRAPDFGLHLSEDRFAKILRYWAKGPDGTREKLVDNPWAEVDHWVKGYNKTRQAEIEVGTDLTPDEMIFEWTGQEGPGGIPHKSFIERKPKPFGSELKCVCEGTFGICTYIELQKGKVRMARQK
jgi:hypothetical protein